MIKKLIKIILNNNLNNNLNNKLNNKLNKIRNKLNNKIIYQNYNKKKKFKIHNLKIIINFSNSIFQKN